MRALTLNRSRVEADARDWLRFAYPSTHGRVRGVDQSFECVQRAGEVLYLPPYVHHAIASAKVSRAIFFIEQQTRWTAGTRDA